MFVGTMWKYEGCEKKTINSRRCGDKEASSRTM